jgi:SAM-dependent methyltransferase
MKKNKTLSDGDQSNFDKNWKNREEKYYLHWTPTAPTNQIQLAFRMHWILFNEFISDRVEGKNVLEVGCGRGSMSAYFADNGYNCSLLDSSRAAIKTARKIFNQINLKADFFTGDATKLPFNDSVFDITFSIGLLEHFEDIKTPIREQVRVLKSGGLFIGYIVPKYENNIQKDYDWINLILKGLAQKSALGMRVAKQPIFRSDDGSEKYLQVLNKEPVIDINTSGVYPLPMISYSPDFPFTLLPAESELALVDHFISVLDTRKEHTGRNPWLCEEGYGQAFVIWCYKK